MMKINVNEVTKVRNKSLSCDTLEILKNESKEVLASLLCLLMQKDVNNERLVLGTYLKNR